MEESDLGLSIMKSSLQIEWDDDASHVTRCLIRLKAGQLVAAVFLVAT